MTTGLFRSAMFAVMCSAAVLAHSQSAAAKSVDYTFTKDVEEDVTQTLDDTLPSISASDTVLQARRQARRSETITKDVLNSYGYYAPNIRTSVVETSTGPTPTLSIDPGPRFQIDRIVLNYAALEPRAEDQSALTAHLPLKAGSAAIPERIIDAERIINTKLRELGYAFAEVSSRDVIGDKESAALSVRYNIVSGPRVRFGETLYPDNIKTRTKYLERINPLEVGALYDPAKLALYKSRLSDTRLFRSSQAVLTPAQPQNGGNGENDGTQTFNITTKLKERPRNTLAAGVDFDTFDGFGATVQLTRRNLTRLGDTLIASTRLAEREAELDMIWRRPNELGFGRGMVVTATLRQEDTDAFEQSLARLGLGYEVVESPQFNYNYGVKGQLIRQTETNDTAQNFQTLSTYAGVNINRADSLLDPRKGWRANGEIAPSYAFGGDEPTPFLKALGHFRYYRPMDDKGRFVLASRLRLGTVIASDINDIPSETRFYAGGGGSVRGYSYQAIGPTDAALNPTGGRSLIDGSIEARWRYNDRIGVVAFVDGGDASEKQYPEFKETRLGLGLGARYQTPAGPVRFDVAIPLNKSETDDNFQIYISIGQAF